MSDRADHDVGHAADPPVIAGLDPAIHLLRKKRVAKRMDHPNLGLPKFGHLKCASRINPTCVVKPAGDGGGRASSDSIPLYRLSLDARSIVLYITHKLWN